MRRMVLYFGRAAALALAALFLPVASCGRGGGTPSGQSGGAPRVVIVGLDGADWQIVDRLARENRLPVLSRLRHEGAAGVLMSEPPLISPIVWTTIATGRSPLDHGVFGFLTRRGGVVETVRSDERKVRSFWNVATDNQIPVGVVGWYASWPAEKVDGFLVSDHAGAHLVAGARAGREAGLAQPPELARDVANEQERVRAAVTEQSARRLFTAGADPSLLPPGKLSTLVDQLRTTELYKRLFLAGLEKFRPVIGAVYFEATDSVGHLFVDYSPPPIPGTDPRLASQFGGAFDRMYETIDGVLGEIVARLDPARTTLIVVSDHGFRDGPLRPMIPTADEHSSAAPLWHRPAGLILLWGRGVQRGRELPAQTIYDVLPTVLRLADLPLARSLPGQPIEAALTPEVTGLPARQVADYEAAGPRVLSVPPPPDGEASDERIARLRALGYIGAGGASSVLAGAGDGQLTIPENAFNRAMFLQNDGRRAEALAAFRELERLQPNSPEGFVGEATVLLNLGKADEASVAAGRALALDDRLAPAHVLAGEAKLRGGDDRDGAEHLARALRLDPANSRAALLLGEVLERHGNLDQGEQLLTRAKDVSDQPEDRGLAMVGLASIAEDRRQFDRAEALYREILAGMPAFAPAIERYGNLLLYRGRVAEALGLLGPRTEREQSNARLLALYGIALSMSGRRAEARDYLRRSLTLDPRQPDARQELSRLDR
jgi:predicted AlkP superfamily phosphohydrolase/phosphomutase/tetratricopeptide (TPR) repeat protein